jgi:hypothetical protein
VYVPSMAQPPEQLRAELERIAAEREIAEREAERVVRVELVRVCLECIGSCVLGLFLMGYALHTTDKGTGQIAFLGGLVVGYSGIVLSLASAYRRGVERGDW